MTIETGANQQIGASSTELYQDAGPDVEGRGCHRRGAKIFLRCPYTSTCDNKVTSINTGRKRANRHLQPKIQGLIGTHGKKTGRKSGVLL